MKSDDFSFFIDSLFRGLCKVCGGCVNMRLGSEDIQQITELIFKGRNNLDKDSFYFNVMNNRQLSDFLVYMVEQLQNSLEYSRQESLRNMKINMEVKKVIVQLIIEVDKASKLK
jgi:hypothetical protein